MPLKADVESLRDDTLAGLTAVHNHFVYSKKLWRMFDLEVRRRGRKAVLRNKVTGSRVTEQELLLIAHASANDYLPSATIQQCVSLAETFLTDLVRLWVTAYPAHLKGQVDVQAIVAAPDKQAILRTMIDQFVLAMGYKRPTDWFDQLRKVIAIAPPTDSEIAIFAEFKATRDVFVHNRGVVNEFYLEKAGKAARAALCQPLDLRDEYLHDGWRLCRKIVDDVGSAAILKA